MLKSPRQLCIPLSSWSGLLPRPAIVVGAGMGLLLVLVMNFWTVVTQELPCLQHLQTLIKYSAIGSHFCDQT